MQSQTIIITKITHLNHNVVQLTTTKPDDYSFTPGQATDVSILKNNWKDEKRPFTFTSLPEDEFLEFTIKTYPSHDGVTDQIADLEINDQLLIGEPYGAIHYKGSGTFLAGGAGITPFLSILKDLDTRNKVFGNTLIFSNKTEKDIFLNVELQELLGEKFINTLTKENHEDYKHGRIDADLIKDELVNLKQYFYLCGPPQMVKDVKKELNSIGVEDELIITEDFED